MSDLTQLTRDLIESTHEQDTSRIPDSVRYFIEKVTFSTPEDILSAVHEVLADDWMAMPVWARNLAYRLVCLQRPDDAEVLREAAADLFSFGPDWDEVAEELRARATQLEN
uniref:HEAT repeat domain-containing protein n=1 Tax=Streptomyces sp. NBC_00148 TaxID=2903626 RepID=A0AAU1LMG7_9ACTN